MRLKHAVFRERFFNEVLIGVHIMRASLDGRE